MKHTEVLPSADSAAAHPAKPVDALAPLLRGSVRVPGKAAVPTSSTFMAKVLATHGDKDYQVDLEDGLGQLLCTRAASCLLVPAVGDTILVATSYTGAAFLIAVVAQADAREAHLCTDGALILSSRAGPVQLRSTGLLSLQSDDGISIDAPDWTVTAQRAHFQVGELDYQGAHVRFNVLVSRWVGRTCEAVLDRLHVLTRSTFRLTEGVEQVRAGQIDIQSSTTLRLHAKNTLVTSTELVKVDAEQIHMG